MYIFLVFALRILWKTFYNWLAFNWKMGHNLIWLCCGCRIWAWKANHVTWKGTGTIKLSFY